MAQPLLAPTQNTAQTVAPAPIAPPASPRSWHARLDLTLARTERGSRLIRSRHHGPLYVQKPFYPEGPELAHIYILHPPGGLVSGDWLEISVQAQPNSQALFTTPGAGRVYHARADRCLQHQQVTLTLAENSRVEWLPTENIIYPDAFGQLNTRVELAHNSRVIAWEITCLGLPASQQPFDRGELRQRLEIVRDGRLIYRDQTHLDANNPELIHGKAGLQGRTVSGIMVAGPFPKQAHDSTATELKQQLRQIAPPASDLLAITQIDELILIRYLGHCSQSARRLLIECWQRLRPALMERPACQPRIWAT